MAHEVDTAEEFVVLASFESRHAAERMLASLGRELRRQTRKGHAGALVISANKDGSLKLTESRVLTVGGFSATVMRLSASVALGFMGLISTLKAVKGGVHETHVRQAHAGSDEHAVHAILAKAGPHASLVVFPCDNQETRDAVLARASDSASESWHGSRTQFLSSLDADSGDDWLRAALGEPTSTIS
jgi:hypothetical protein